MSVDVLLGLQWGDEGKGKIVDFLTPKYNVIARFQGGPNAGHTLKFGDTKHVLHQIPSGIFHKGAENVIGNGVVLDPAIFKEEILACSRSEFEDSLQSEDSQREYVDYYAATNQMFKVKETDVELFILINDSEIRMITLK